MGEGEGFSGPGAANWPKQSLTPAEDGRGKWKKTVLSESKSTNRK